MKKLILMLFVAAFVSVACDSNSPAPGKERSADGVEKATPAEKAKAEELKNAPGRE